MTNSFAIPSQLQQPQYSGMPVDPFDDLLGLEDEFYQEGHDAGLADGEHAGLAEGKVFGIEKGYEKAIELGRLQGRVTVWKIRQTRSSESKEVKYTQNTCLLNEELGASRLPLNNRVAKNIEALLSLTSHQDIRRENSDDAVTEFDDRITKAQAKAKVIAAVVNEPLKGDSLSNTGAGIEETFGLNARQ